MSEDNPGEQILDYAGRFIGSAFFERVAHGTIRRGFLVSWAIAGASAVGLAIWLYFNPDIHSKVTLAGVCFFVGVGIFGSMVQTDTDLADQQSSRYSKWGSGWNLWGDNIIFNQITKFFEVIGVCACLIGTVYFASQAAAERSAAAKAAEQAAQRATSAKYAAAHAAAHSAAHATTMKANSCQASKSHHAKSLHHEQSAASEHHQTQVRHVTEETN